MIVFTIAHIWIRLILSSVLYYIKVVLVVN
jgi:hypothetical protein